MVALDFLGINLFLFIERYMTHLYNTLSDLNISYDMYEHDAVFTCDEVAALNVNMKGVHTKSLFLRDDKGKRHFLVVLPAEKKIALNELSERIGAKRLGFASTERLNKYLCVEPGSVSPLAIINDAGKKVELYVDEAFKDEREIQCHPLVNTATIVLSMNDIQLFAKATGHDIHFITV